MTWPRKFFVGINNTGMKYLGLFPAINRIGRACQAKKSPANRLLWVHCTPCLTNEICVHHVSDKTIYIHMNCLFWWTLSPVNKYIHINLMLLMAWVVVFETWNKGSTIFIIMIIGKYDSFHSQQMAFCDDSLPITRWQLWRFSMFTLHSQYRLMSQSTDVTWYFNIHLVKPFTSIRDGNFSSAFVNIRIHIWQKYPWACIYVHWYPWILECTWAWN